MPVLPNVLRVFYQTLICHLLSTVIIFNKLYNVKYFNSTIGISGKLSFALLEGS